MSSSEKILVRSHKKRIRFENVDDEDEDDNDERSDLSLVKKRSKDMCRWIHDMADRIESEIDKKLDAKESEEDLTEFIRSQSNGISSALHFNSLSIVSPVHVIKGKMRKDRKEQRRDRVKEVKELKKMTGTMNFNGGSDIDWISVGPEGQWLVESEPMKWTPQKALFYTKTLSMERSSFHNRHTASKELIDLLFSKVNFFTSFSPGKGMLTTDIIKHELKSLLDSGYIGNRKNKSNAIAEGFRDQIKLILKLSESDWASGPNPLSALSFKSFPGAFLCRFKMPDSLLKLRESIVDVLISCREHEGISVVYPLLLSSLWNYSSRVTRMCSNIQFLFYCMKLIESVSTSEEIHHVFKRWKTVDNPDVALILFEMTNKKI